MATEYIMDSTKSRIRRMRAHSKLVHVRFAAYHGIVLAQQAHDGCIVRTAKIAEDVRRARSREVGRANVIFYCNWAS